MKEFCALRIHGISIRSLLLVFLSFQNADAFGVSEMQAASWRYVQEAIGDCTSYATTIPRNEYDPTLTQVRVQHRLVNGKCKYMQIVANQPISCYFSPEQRKDIRTQGKVAIDRLLADASTCGNQAEQLVLSSATVNTVIQRLPARDVASARSARDIADISPSAGGGLEEKIFIGRDALQSTRPAK